MRLEDNKKIIRNETSLKILEKAKTHSKYILVLIVLFRLLNVDYRLSIMPDYLSTRSSVMVRRILKTDSHWLKMVGYCTFAITRISHSNDSSRTVGYHYIHGNTAPR